jgi:hypothetical protein
MVALKYEYKKINTSTFLTILLSIRTVLQIDLIPQRNEAKPLKRCHLSSEHQIASNTQSLNQKCIARFLVAL